jgi:hypothetical protein
VKPRVVPRSVAAAAEVDEAELVRQAQEMVPEAPDLSTECEDPCGSPDRPLVP